MLLVIAWAASRRHSQFLLFSRVIFSCFVPPWGLSHTDITSSFSHIILPLVGWLRFSQADDPVWVSRPTTRPPTPQPPASKSVLFLSRIARSHAAALRRTPLSTPDLGLLLAAGGQRALSPWWRPSVNDASSIRRRVFIIGRLCHDSGGLVALPCVGFRGFGTPQWSREWSRERSRERPRLDSGCGRACPGLELFGGLDGLVFYLCFLPRWEGARSHQIPTVG